MGTSTSQAYSRPSARVMCPLGRAAGTDRATNEEGSCLLVCTSVFLKQLGNGGVMTPAIVGNAHRAVKNNRGCHAPASQRTHARVKSKRGHQIADGPKMGGVCRCRSEKGKIEFVGAKWLVL